MNKPYPQNVYLLGEPYGAYRVPWRITWRVFAAEVFAAGLGVLLLFTGIGASGTVQQVLCVSAALPVLIVAGYTAVIHVGTLMTVLVVAPKGLARIRWHRAELFYWQDVTINAISPGLYIIYRDDGQRITHVALTENQVSNAIERKFRMQNTS